MQPPTLNLNLIDARPLPAWFDSDKFGIFIHWGVYAVPAFAPVTESTSISLNCAEWYLRKLKMSFKDHGQTRAYHARTYGESTDYYELAQHWKAEKWNPQEWANEFAQTGARYVVLTAKHHDGFTLWPTSYVTYADSSVADAGPKRDIVGELAAAVRSRGMRFGCYYSLLEWYNTLFLSTKKGDYVHEIVHPQMQELIETYRPDVLWCDGDWSKSAKYWGAEEFLQWLYQESSVRDSVVCNDRWGEGAKPARLGTYSCAVDRQKPDRVLPHKWECCYTIGKSWGFNAQQTDQHYKSSARVLEDFVYTIAYGGNFLLNVGPQADGTLAPQEVRCLRDVGKWMKSNSEAIYSSTPLRVPSIVCELGTAYFTKPKHQTGCVYVLFALRAPLTVANTFVNFGGVPFDARDATATFLGSNLSCKLHHDATMVGIYLPIAVAAEGGPFVVRLEGVRGE